MYWITLFVLIKVDNYWLLDITIISCSWFIETNLVLHRNSHCLHLVHEEFGQIGLGPGPHRRNRRAVELGTRHPECQSFVDVANTLELSHYLIEFIKTLKTGSEQDRIGCCFGMYICEANEILKPTSDCSLVSSGCLRLIWSHIRLLADDFPQTMQWNPVVERMPWRRTSVTQSVDIAQNNIVYNHFN